MNTRNEPLPPLRDPEPSARAPSKSPGTDEATRFLSWMLIAVVFGLTIRGCSMRCDYNGWHLRINDNAPTPAENAPRNEPAPIR